MIWRVQRTEMARPKESYRAVRRNLARQKPLKLIRLWRISGNTIPWWKYQCDEREAYRRYGKNT